ncbi:kinase-like protein [Calocera cornea HHB12733]|uniref:Kinase-like protein n=1 Tax=Calocera cornea HHB12733 TaxID=1353952 RepID=A0A165F9X8_9BASI|nr:kinase-like protein [Calocera cornea HHB12733]
MWFIRHRKIPAVPRVINLYGGMLAKSTTYRELDALTYINSVDGLHLPVPQVLDGLVIPRHIRGYFNCGSLADDEGSVLLLMTSLPGKPVGAALNDYSDTQVARLAKQLFTVFHSIRELSPTNNMVCGVGGRGCTSYLMSLSTFGPFDSVASFNAWMVLRAESRLGSVRMASLPKRIDDAETRFSHGDLTPRNVLVDEQGNLTGVIDWEAAGWMPRHWDPAYVS